MPSSLIILTGAPLAEHLDWSEASLNTGSDQAAIDTRRSILSTSPKWRAIAVSPALEREVSSQRPPTSQPTSDDQETNERALPGDDNIDESVAFLDRFDSSDLSPLRLAAITGPSSQNADQSFYSALTDSGLFDETSNLTSSNPQYHELMTHAFTDLQHLPRHDYLQRISPQTVTVDLMVAIVSIRPTKTVQLRRRNTQMDIVELIVGDETRAGFGINIWLAPRSQQGNLQDDVARLTCRLRSGDLVAFNNLGLSSFKGVVHGQTLNRRFTRTSTAMTKIDRATAASLHPSSKLKRVYDWSLRFATPSEAVLDRQGSRHDRARTGEVELLPPDTPSTQ